MVPEDTYRGEHILPRSWWEGLPTFAQAVWIKAYLESEEQDDTDPSMAAWDRVRNEYVFWPKEGWLRKDSITAYRETSDGTSFIWLNNSKDWAGGMRPAGELSLPGNRYISEDEAAVFTGEVRRVYEQHYRRVSGSVDDPHEIACRRVRAQFRETDEGWKKRPTETGEESSRKLKERVKLDSTMLGDLFPDDTPEGYEQMVRGEYPYLPEFLKERYREGYREGLREGHHSPIQRGWQAITADYISDGGTWRLRPEEDREMFHRIRGDRPETS